MSLNLELGAIQDPAVRRAFEQIAKQFPIKSQLLANDSVGSTQIAADAVGSSEIATDAVGSAEIAADAVGTSEIAPSAVTTTEILDNTIAVGDLATATVNTWLRLAVAGNRKIDFGSTAVTYPGGSITSTALSVSHSVGAVPLCVVVSGSSNSGLTTYPAWTAQTVTNISFLVAATTVDGQTPVAGSTSSFYWLAIG